ncbi:alpha/beta hydrolase [Nocardia sp. NBC_01730]|uniref:alpha/beta fold hydrolase n=1 Tax=Nocardia sp. NBC_01730 TaxID=2975998 RepID=UPI002E120DD0|nr:alpha/beta hydrolase [Nocardia sp. NBC_01730]
MTAVKREQVEVAHRTVDVDGLRMHIAEAGTGPLVLLLHGWPESWYSWRHQIPALATAGYHVVAPDQRGYGDTDVPERVQDYTIKHLVGDVTRLIDVLGKQRATVIGHDWGAIVAWEMAKMYPQRVTGVAGLSIPDRFAEPRGGAATPIADVRATLGEAFYIVHFQQPGVADAALASALEHDPEGLFRRIFRTASGDGPGWSGMVPGGGTIVDSLADETPTLLDWEGEQDAKTYAAQFQKSGFTGGINWYRNLDRNWELSAAWRDNRVHAPALYLIGGRDGALALPQSQQLMSGGSGFLNLRETVVLPGVGHAIQQERPDRVNEVLIRFLQSL